MATISKNRITREPQWGSPNGNGWRKRYRFETNASGYFVDSDTPSTAVGNGDVVRVGVLPAGADLHDCTVIISDAFAASTTASIGFAYVDGVDSTAVPQNATYFASALSTASTGVSRKTSTTAPVILPKDAYLILTVGGAAHSAAGIVDVIVEGIWTGIPGA